MHELGIALVIAERAAMRAEGRRVRRVVVEVGALTAVLPDALAFAWEAIAADGGELGDAALEIVVIPGRGRCRGCEREQELAVPYGRCSCGTTDLALVSGQELRIRELEVDDVRDLRMSDSRSHS